LWLWGLWLGQDTRLLLLDTIWSQWPSQLVTLR
jgi:hypothetical protein